MAGTKRARSYVIYVVAIFVSAIFALIGKPAPAWVMRATAPAASAAPAAHKAPVKHAASQPKRTVRVAKAGTKRQSPRRAQGKTARLARKNTEKTGLSGAAIVAGEHHA